MCSNKRAHLLVFVFCFFFLFIRNMPLFVTLNFFFFLKGFLVGFHTFICLTCLLQTNPFFFFLHICLLSIFIFSLFLEVWGVSGGLISCFTCFCLFFFFNLFSFCKLSLIFRYVPFLLKQCIYFFGIVKLLGVITPKPYSLLLNYSLLHEFFDICFS